MPDQTDPTMWDQFIEWRNQQAANQPQPGPAPDVLPPPAPDVLPPPAPDVPPPPPVDVLPPPAPPIPGVPPPVPAPVPEPEPETATSSSSSKALPEVGATVEFCYFDPRAGSDAAVKNTSRFGVVVEIVHEHADGSPILDVDNQPAPAARIGWFTDVSDPVPVDDLAW